MERLIIIGIIIYWTPIFLYLIIWSFKIRWHVRKYNIKSLDMINPLTYKYGKLTNFQLIGESLLYICAMFIGIFLYFFLPKNMIKDSILPDA